MARGLIYSYNIATLGNLLKLRGVQSLIYMWEKISISWKVKDNEMLHIQKLGLWLPGEVLPLLGLLLVPTMLVNTL